ncbi:MAG: hypothetical protein ACPGU1_17195 [Myxococcota bacterium]
MKDLTTRAGWLFLALALVAAGCADDRFDNVPAYNGDESDDGSNQTAQLALTPTVTALEKDTLVVGETVYFYGDGFLHPDDGQTFLTFEGKYVWSDGEGEVHEQVPPFTIQGLYDGEFPEGGQLGEMNLAAGTRVLRWNRFGPFSVPFGGQGRKPGTFQGTISAVNVTAEGEAYETTEPLNVELNIKPSILITRLEPIVGYEGTCSTTGTACKRDTDCDDGNDTCVLDAMTPECGSPALRIFGGLPYIMEVETIGFEPEYFVYRISNANNSDTWIEISHQASGPTDILGSPAADGSEKPIIFNPLNENEEFAVASIYVTAIDANDNTIETALPVRIVRPLAFHYDGSRRIAEYYEPELVHTAIPGAVASTITYTESESESRQRGVSINVSQSYTQGQSSVQTSNWSDGFSFTNSASQTNSVGQSHSESENSSSTYGTTYSQAASNNVNVASTDGTTWGWNTTESESEEEFEDQTLGAFGDVSLGMTTQVGAEGSIPGFAKVSGSVGTSVGTTVGAKTDSTQGTKSGSSSSNGMHMDSSSSDTVGYGSTTTDTSSNSVSGSYAVASQSTMSNSTAVTSANSESVTYQMGGSAGITENYTTGASESWSETWQTSSTDTKLLSFTSLIPNGKCAVIYRQTVRHVKTSQLYAYDRCGVRSLVGEMHFNEWSWSPNIAIGDDCDSLPEPDLPKAACFSACD